MQRLWIFIWFAALFLAAPASAEDLSGLERLEQQLASSASENPGEFGIAALDLETGQVVSFNGSEAFPMASTMKIAVAAAYLAEVDAGRRSLNERIGRSTALSLMERMMIRSDNWATDRLIATLGGAGTVNHWLQSHDVEGMRVDRTIAQLLRARRDLHDIRDSSTPLAMLELLRLVDGDEALKPRSRALLLDMMRRCVTGSTRIRGLMPRDVMVQNKTGTLRRFASDVGYLTLPSGKRIAVAFFARGAGNRSGVIATSARAIHDAFRAEERQASAAGRTAIRTDVRAAAGG